MSRQALPYCGGARLVNAARSVRRLGHLLIWLRDILRIPVEGATTVEREAKPGAALLEVKPSRSDRRLGA